jgi:class 3 adenylate cyclase
VNTDVEALAIFLAWEENDARALCFRAVINSLPARTILPAAEGVPLVSSSRSMSLEVSRHFQIEKETKNSPDRGVLLMQRSFRPLMAICVVYAVLYWWWSMFACLVHQVVALCIGILWWQLLRKDYVCLAKVVFLFNWFLSVLVLTMVLTSESGMPVASIILACVWMILFDVDLSKPLMCFVVALVTSGFWAVLQYSKLQISYGALSEQHLVQVNRIMSPLIAVTTIFVVCSMICWLKMVNRDRESSLNHECSLVDRIVLGLLPSQIVKRLKNGETLIADWRPMACILFMDIVGFTDICSKMPPRQIVKGLVSVFSDIEAIVKKYPRIEKVKTIGDAFMCASGLLDSHPDHQDVVQIAQLALELRASSFCMQIEDESLGHLKIPIVFRFGIHCGEVVAGVISKERFTFDVLGDSVNIASRMESTSKPNTIQVSEEIKDRLAHLFEFADNGIQQVKGKGQMRTFSLISPL